MGYNGSGRTITSEDKLSPGFPRAISAIVDVLPSYIVTGPVSWLWSNRKCRIYSAWFAESDTAMSSASVLVFVTVAFLATRVKKYTEDDASKLVRLVRYIRFTKDSGAVLRPGMLGICVRVHSGRGIWGASRRRIAHRQLHSYQDYRVGPCTVDPVSR